MELSSIRHIVKTFLQKDMFMRDDDKRLIIEVWHYQRPRLRFEPFSVFCGEFVSGGLASPESIRRVRQKLQEEHPELRGSTYAARHKHAEDVKEELQAPEWKQGGTP